MTTDELRAADRECLWHPFTQMAGWIDEDAPIIERAQGTTVWDTDGRAYLDGTSSLWCNVHGHRHPHIDAAVRDQLDRVAHSTMLGLSHRPAIELGRRLVELAPDGLSRVFYSDSGATSVEVALKMAYQWWVHHDQPQRTRYVCLKMSYHGDTLGAVAVGGIELFHSRFAPLLFEAHQAEPGDEHDMQFLLDEHRDEIAAVIVEPIVQGAAGIHPMPRGYLRAVREMCDEAGVFLICDEVATGFGRTGTMFACEQEGVSPDFLCLAKGLTGGYLPLAATLTTERVYEGFLGPFEAFRTFFHGHTYTGNPLGCAAALATLEVFEREHTLAALAPKIELLTALLDTQVAVLPAVTEVRQAGFMVAIELHEHPIADRIGHQVTLHARKRGAIVRPLGDAVVLMPPLSITADELRRLVSITAEAITAATGSALADAA